MQQFDYIASDTSGKLIRGQIKAPDKFLASQHLAKQALFILEIKPTTQTSINPTPTARLQPLEVSKSKPTAIFNATPPDHSLSLQPAPTQQSYANSWSQLERALYLRQLAIMFGIGIPLHQITLRLLQSKTLRPKTLERLHLLQQNLEKGSSFAKALERSGLFTPLIISAVSLGEKSGKLYNILLELATAEERSVTIKKEILSKLAYPAFILAILCGGLVALANIMSMVMGSIPSLETRVPLWLRVINSSLQNKMLLPVLFLALAFFILTASRLQKSCKARLILWQILFSTPYLGRLLVQIEGHSLTSYLALLVKIGLPLDQSLILCSRLVRSQLFSQGLLKAAERVKNGDDLYASLQKETRLSFSLLALIQAGEISGRLDNTLKVAAAYCSSQLQYTIETTLSLLEPALLGLLGTAIGLILIFTFAPIFSGLQEL